MCVYRMVVLEGAYLLLKPEQCSAHVWLSGRRQGAYMTLAASECTQHQHYTYAWVARPNVPIVWHWQNWFDQCQLFGKIWRATQALLQFLKLTRMPLFICRSYFNQGRDKCFLRICFGGNVSHWPSRSRRIPQHMCVVGEQCQGAVGSRQRAGSIYE